MRRRQLDEQLDALNTSLVEMGAMIEHAIHEASEALFTGDIELAEEVSANDYRIDKKEKEIEGLSMKLLISQQPVARDLRQVSVALKMITDMERIGDHAADISEITVFLAEHEAFDEYEIVREMALASGHMVKESIDAFVRLDSDLARKVIKDDDFIDTSYNTLRKRLVQLIHENPEIGEQAFDLMQVAKYYERIGDHATNIAKWVIYAVTGKYAKAPSKKNGK